MVSPISFILACVDGGIFVGAALAVGCCLHSKKRASACSPARESHCTAHSQLATFHCEFEQRIFQHFSFIVVHMRAYVRMKKRATECGCEY